MDEVPYIDSYNDKYPADDAVQSNPDDKDEEKAEIAYLKILGDDLSVSLDTPVVYDAGEETTAN